MVIMNVVSSDTTESQSFWCTSDTGSVPHKLCVFPANES